MHPTFAIGRGMENESRYPIYSDYAKCITIFIGSIGRYLQNKVKQNHFYGRNMLHNIKIGLPLQCVFHSIRLRLMKIGCRETTFSFL